MTVSVVVSVYNENEALPHFWQELLCQINTLDYSFEIIFINDGSTDGSADIIDEFATADKRVKAVHFSRNYGHEAAMLAGIELSKGDCVICMDSDLQHPPTCIGEMLNKHAEGFEIVTMVREQRADGGLIKRITSSLFYSILNKISGGQFKPNATDFFLISRRIVKVIVSNFPEKTRFLRGLIQTIGFKSASIPFSAPERVAGESKYSLTKLFLLSISAIATFSHVPLKLGLGIGLIFSGFSLFITIYSLVMKFLGEPFSGYTSLIILMSLGFSLLFIVIGIIGEYIGFIFREVKNRPSYIIDRVTGQKQDD